MALGHSQLHHSHRADLHLRGEDCTGCVSGEATFWAILEPCYRFLHYLLSSWSSAPRLITFPIVVARLSDKTSLGEEGLILAFYLRVQSTVAEEVWWEEREAGSHYTTARKQRKMNAGH